MDMGQSQLTVQEVQLLNWSFNFWLKFLHHYLSIIFSLEIINLMFAKIC